MLQISCVLLKTIREKHGNMCHWEGSVRNILLGLNTPFLIDMHQKMSAFPGPGLQSVH